MRITLALLGLLFAGCSEDKPAPIDGTAGSLDTPSVPCTDVADAIYGDPGALSPDRAARGNIVKCTKDPDITKDALQAKLVERGYKGKPVTSDARVYRISYRTERGDAASTPSVSSAIVYIPATPRAAKLPVIVAARGSRGQAARCAVSKFDPSLDDINGDAYRLVYSLVGSGYAVILPDLAGYANFDAPGNPPSAYAQAADVGRSTLDGSRALKKMFPVLDDKVVLVGHSQGGHSALAALSLQESYGASGPIAGVAVYAPLWLSQRSWGAVLYRLAGRDFPLDGSPAGAVSVWYHYTQAELLDGPGEGKKLFAADKQTAIETFVKNECWGSTELAKLGKYADELFDPSFVSDVGSAATSGLACQNERCQKWVDRYSADRPHLTGKAAETPILLAYGLKDTTLPPPRMQCALDRLKADNVKLTMCVEPEEGHGSIVTARGEYVADWIASIALGAAAPGGCPSDQILVSEGDAGTPGPVTCATPPPND